MKKLNLQDLLEQTIQCGGTDLHICPGAVPFIRKNRELMAIEIPPLDAQAVKSLTDEAITVEQKRSLLEKKVMAFSFSIGGVGRFRACAYSQRGTYALTIRVLPFGVPDYKKIGLPKDLATLTALEKGLVVVAGASGSGKTTTLAAFVKLLNDSRICHIATIEDPIEYLHRHKKAFVTQREIGVDAPDVPTALQWATKSDADVIVLSEIPRDAKTLSLALAIAEEKLVLSCVNANDVTGAIKKIIVGGNTSRSETEQENIRSRLYGVLKNIIFQEILPRDTFNGIKIKCDVIFCTHDFRERNLARKQGE